MSSIKYYGKDNCAPCKMMKPIVESRIAGVEIITLKEDGEVLSIGERFGIKTVPFLVVNDSTAISGRDLRVLVYSLKNI